MRKIPLLIVLSLVCFQLTSVLEVAGQDPPRGGGRERVGGKRPPEKADKWVSGQRKGEFKRAVDGQVREKRPDREERSGRTVERVDKGTKWKGEFKRAVDGKIKERRQPERRDRTGDVAKHVDKTTKWARSQKVDKLEPGKHTERFNEAANPKRPPDGGGGTKTGGAAAPPTGPKP